MLGGHDQRLRQLTTRPDRPRKQGCHRDPHRDELAANDLPRGLMSSRTARPDVEPVRRALLVMIILSLLCASVSWGGRRNHPVVAGVRRFLHALRRPDYRNPGSLVSSAHRLPCTLGSRRSQTSTTWAKLRRTICWPAYICKGHP